MKFFQSQFEKAKQNKLTLFIFLIIFLIGIFLRSYHFSDWLHFEIDQTYDINIVSKAVDNGPGDLPLLGPTAGGGRALRLGPAFYYMEYLSALIFGNTPQGHAAQVLILSILAIPLFYFFCRKYFSQNIALSLVTIFSFSSYMVLYSRFSWSPNILPFLVLLSFYALLRSVSPSEKKKSPWFLLAAFFIAITTQIHFNSLFIVASCVFFFLLITRPRFPWKVWLSAAGIFLVFYSPMIISDIKTGGQNLGYFLEKVPKLDSQDERSSKKKDGLSDRLVQDIRYQANEYFLIISGIDQINGSHLTGSSLGLTCKSCKKDLILRLIPYLLMLTSVLILLINLKREKDQEKKNFLILVSLWFFLSFAYFFLVLTDGMYIYPRFFLSVSPLAIISLGLILEKLSFSNKYFGIFFAIVTVALLAFPNLSRLKNNFDQLKNADRKSYKAETEDLFPDNTRATQKGFILTVDYIVSQYQKNNFPVYIKTDHEFEPVFWYYLNKKGIYFWNDFPKDIFYRDGNYFYIEQGSKIKSKEGLSDLAKSFDVAEKKNFGILTAIYLSPKPEAVTSDRQDENERKIPIEDYQISQLLTWSKL